MRFSSHRAVTCLVALPAAAWAGPAPAASYLDVYLNNIRLDQRTKSIPDSRLKEARQLPLTTGRSLGQTFTTGPAVRELQAICIQSLTWGGEWGEGTAMIMRVYDGPAKARKLAESRMEYDWRCWDNGKIVFAVNLPAAPGREYYFELTAEGGDGRAGVLQVSPEDYAPGRAYLDGSPQEFDLVFEDYVRPAWDRDAGYAAQFAKINLDYPGMEQVKAAVGKREWDAAARELVNHFEHKPGLRQDLTGGMQKLLQPDPRTDLTDARLAAEMKVRDPDGQVFSLGPNWCHLRWWAKRGGIGLTRDGLRDDLAIGYLNTHDERYVVAFNAMLKAFFVDCPSQLRSGILPPDAREAPALFDGGIGGARMWDGLALSARLRHQFWYYMVFAESPKFEWDVRAAFIMNLVDMAEVLYVQKGGGNWEDQMAYGLFEFGRQFPEFARSRDFIQRGFDRLVVNMRKTMLPDGPMGEAPGYQQMIHDQYRMMLNSAREAKVEVPADLVRQVEKAFEYHLFTIQPDGDRPAFGDSIGWDGRAFLLKGARDFNRPDMLWVATDGREGTRPTITSTQFPFANYYVMRSDWTRDARYLCLRNGWYGHGHFDALGFILHSGGNPQIIDPGVYVYGTPDTQRLISTASHSTVQVDGRNLQNRSGTNRFLAGGCADLYIGTGPAYDGLDASIRTTRRLVFLKPACWVVSDVVTGPGEHQVDSRFHFADTNAVLDARTQVATTTHPKGGKLAVIPTEPGRITSSLEKGDNALTFETLKPALVLRQSVKTHLPVRLDNVLYPFDREPQAGVTVERPASANAADVVLRVARPEGVDHLVFTSSDGGAVAAGDLKARAACAVVRTGLDGSVTGFALLGGRELALGKPLVQCDETLAGLDVVYDRECLRITSEGTPASLRVAAGRAKTLIVNGAAATPIQAEGGHVRPFAGPASSPVGRP